MDDRPLVIYHANCMDGLVAAWAVKMALGEVETLAADYGDAPPDVRGRRVIIVDFSYPRETLEKMFIDAASLIVLDHHKTAAEALAGLPYAVFDMTRSGASLAWDHFFLTAPRPWIIDYVEDRDLWRWALPHSKEINAYLSVIPKTMGMIDRIARGKSADLIALGETVLLAQRVYLDETKRQARMGVLKGHTSPFVPIVNAGRYCHSELIGELAEGHPFAVGWCQLADGEFLYSLRSRDGGEDVSAIAKKLGGGGHRNAARFKSKSIAHLFPESPRT